MPIPSERAAEFLGALLENTSDFIMIADREGRPQVWNRAYADIIRQALGIEMEVGLRPHERLPDPAGVAFWDELHRRVLGGERFTIEVGQEFPDAGVRHFAFTFNPILRDGRVDGFCEISREITAATRAEAALVESERTLRESQEAARIGSYRLDIAGDHWTSSPILDAIFGIDPGCPRTVAGWGELVHPDWRETMLAYFEDEVVGKRRPFDKEYQIVRVADGAVRWVHGLGRLRLDAHGGPVEMVGTIRDVTERHSMQERLQQQEKMEAVGQLAGGIAHDFNNQLVGILGYADLIRAKADPGSEVAHHAAQIVTSAERAADLTTQLLAFSRRGHYRNVIVDLHRVVGEVVAVLERTIDKRIAIHRALAADPPTTVGDPTLLQSAILNLALNARDAMPQGGRLSFVTDVVAIASDGDPSLPLAQGRYVRIRVTDTGVGMDAETQSHIFEPFFTTKEPGKGTGMGLAAAYGTIQSHRGLLVATSAPAAGTTMALYLPHVEHTEPVVAAGTDEGPAPSLRGARVLVIDDERAVRKATAAILERAGAHVEQCSDGTAAVAVVRELGHELDVIILDMVMPTMGGSETFRALRAIDPHARVILSSGYSLDGEAEQLLRDGALGFLQKPFLIGELTAMVAAALSGR